MTLQQLKERKIFLTQQLEEADNVGNFIACMAYGNALNVIDRLIGEKTVNKRPKEIEEAIDVLKEKLIERNSGVQIIKVNDKDKDEYICPAGSILKRWKGKTPSYTNPKACKDCPHKDKCTKSKRGRVIQRDEHEEIMESATNRYNENYELYKIRQQLVEHPFGTLKRSLGFTYFLTRKNKLGTNWIDLEREIKNVVNEFRALEFALYQTSKVRCEVDKEHRIHQVIRDLGLTSMKTDVWNEITLAAMHDSLHHWHECFSKALELYISELVNKTSVQGISPDIVEFEADAFCLSITPILMRESTAVLSGVMQ